MLWPQFLKSFLARLPAWLRAVIVYTPALLWAGMIFWFSAQSYLPTLEEPTLEWLWKKLAHFLVYGGLYFWLWWGTGWLQSKRLANTHLILQLLLLVLLYAVSDEYHQSFIANRHPAVMDIGIDLLGGMSSAILLRQFAVKRV
jgi:VanZ family protein